MPTRGNWHACAASRTAWAERIVVASESAGKIESLFGVGR